MSWPTTLWECAESVRAAHVLLVGIVLTVVRSLRPTTRRWDMSTRWRLDGNSSADPTIGCTSLDSQGYGTSYRSGTYI